MAWIEFPRHPDGNLVALNPDYITQAQARARGPAPSEEPACTTLTMLDGTSLIIQRPYPEVIAQLRQEAR